MSEPGVAPRSESSASREMSKDEVLAAARPLPSLDEMLIEGLTDDEAQRFLDAIVSA